MARQNIHIDGSDHSNPVLLYTPECVVCGEPRCIRPHRFFTYEGYLMYLISESPEPAPNMEIDAILFLAEDADKEFGAGHPIGVCVVCRRRDCKRPHRKYTMDGYAKWQLEVAGVERGDEAVLRAKEEFRKWAGVPMHPGDKGGGGRAGGGGDGGMPGAGPKSSTGPGGYPGTGPGGYPGAGPGPRPGPAPQQEEDYGNVNFEDYVRIIKGNWARETAGKSPREIEELREKYKRIWKDTAGRGINMQMPWDEEPRHPPPRPDPPRGYGSVPRQGPGNPYEGSGGPGAQRRQSYNGPPPPRPDPGRGYGSVPNQESRNPSGGGGGPGPQRYEPHNEPAPPRRPSTGGSPRDGYDWNDGLTFEQSKTIYKNQWEKYTTGKNLETCRLWKKTLKNSWEKRHGSRAKGVSMPWDDIPDKSESRRAASTERPAAGHYEQGSSRGYYPPRAGSPRRDRDRDRGRRNSTSGDSYPTYIELTDDYEETRAHFEKMWDQKSIGKDREGLRELRAVMEVAWEQRTGEMGSRESMPWHSNYVRRPYSYNRRQSQAPRARTPQGDEKYLHQKLQFEKEWFALSRDKDATKRYHLAHMLHATFIAVVGDRGKNEEMPWSKDYRSSPPPPPSAPRKPSPVRQASHVREPSRVRERSRVRESSPARVSRRHSPPSRVRVRKTEPPPSAPRKPSPVRQPSRVREPSRARVSRRDSPPPRVITAEPPPAWIGSADYEQRRRDLNRTFITRIDGKSREEMERIAMSFREMWRKDAGVRANDHDMAWDDILAQRRDTRLDSRNDSNMLSERFGRMGFDDRRGQGREREGNTERGRSRRKQSSNGHRTRKNSSCGPQ